MVLVMYFVVFLVLISIFDYLNILFPEFLKISIFSYLGQTLHKKQC